MMTTELFIATAFYGAVAISFTAFFAAATVVLIFYSYKMAEVCIKRRARYIRRIKKSPAFKAYSKELPVLVKKNGKAAAKVESN